MIGFQVYDWVKLLNVSYLATFFFLFLSRESDKLVEDGSSSSSRKRQLKSSSFGVTTSKRKSEELNLVVKAAASFSMLVNLSNLLISSNGVWLLFYSIPTHINESKNYPSMHLLQKFNLTEYKACRF